MVAKVQKSKPTSAGVRHKVKVAKAGLSSERPVKSLVKSKTKRTSGRNSAGRITVRHRGGGHKRLLRDIDWKRNRDGIAARVARLEYDPNRSAYLALIVYVDGLWSYIIAPKGLKAGDKVVSGKGAEIKPGNSLKLRDIPVGTTIHNIEMRPGKGAQMIRSAGCSAMFAGREGDWATLKLRSGEMRKIHLDCRATIGEVANSEHSLASLGKAGANRWRGKRPTVRGVAMNPVDHPHGGGEGKTSGGRHPVSPTGVPTKGKVTRNNKRTDKMIVRSRRRKK
ncbi:MAG: 50S ribosomal protein L2 [Pseudomonadota bacterium]|nr:50S ribosomal protein L2 [Pseudomonadota bacterium]